MKKIGTVGVPSVVFSDHVHLLIMFVPRLNKISWVVFIVLAGKSSSPLYLCVIRNSWWCVVLLVMNTEDEEKRKLG